MSDEQIKSLEEQFEARIARDEKIEPKDWMPEEKLPYWRKFKMKPVMDCIYIVPAKLLVLQEMNYTISCILVKQNIQVSSIILPLPGPILVPLVGWLMVPLSLIKYPCVAHLMDLTQEQ